MPMRSIFFILLLCCTFLSSPAERAAQQAHIHSGAGVSATQLPFWTAKHLGIFDKYGLNVELVAISTGARGMQALVGGSTHSANMAVMSPIRTVLGGGEVARRSGMDVAQDTDPAVGKRSRDGAACALPLRQASAL